MIVGIVIVACVILWAVIQRNLSDQGYEPLSRGQLRYMRKKARKQGLDVSEIDYNPRHGDNPFQPPSAKAAKIVRDFERNPYGKQPKAVRDFLSHPNKRRR